MKKRIAINGLGRIGRASLKIILEQPSLELVAVNDIATPENVAYLLKYDSVHGIYEREVAVKDGELHVGAQRIAYLSEKEPANLPWKNLNIDYVIESTGLFTEMEHAQKHIFAGAKHVILSGPTKSNDIPTIVHGVNHPKEGVQIISCASCTTNNISPVIEILGRRIGVLKAIMITIHANTASNKTVDLPSKKDVRMGRSGLNNIIPTTTGAAKATGKALPQYQNRFDGIAVRVPVPIGSLSDITLVMGRETSAQEINNILTEEAATDRYKNVIRTSTEPLVSSDIIKNPYASIIDLPMTKVVDGDLAKILTWYDNEWGFSNQMIRQILID